MPYVGLTSLHPFPLKTPVFMRVSDPVFLYIYLNCQIFGYNKAKKWAKRQIVFLTLDYPAPSPALPHQLLQAELWC